MIDRIEGGKARLAIRVLKGAGRIALGLSQTVTVLHRGFAGLATGLCTVAWGTGALAGLCGITLREYDSADDP
jgi:hypothetical protein